MKRLLNITLIIAFFSCTALADAPLQPAERKVNCSPNGNFCATSDPLEKVTVIKGDSVSWTVPGWHRWLFVSDDGESVVIGYEGMNLVPIDVSLEEKVIFFYHRSNFLRAVKLRDLYLDKSQLKQTASHLAWGSIAGFNHANQLVVELVTGSKVAFSAKSGLPEKLAER